MQTSRRYHPVKREIERDDIVYTFSISGKYRLHRPQQFKNLNDSTILAKMNIVSGGFENIQVRELLTPVDHEIESQSGIERSQHMNLALRQETVHLNK